MNCNDVEKFRTELYDLVNNCNLSIATAFYVIKDFYRDFNQTYLNILQQERSHPQREENGVILEYNTKNNQIQEEQE